MSPVLVFRPEAEEELEAAFAFYQSRQAGLGFDLLCCVDEAAIQNRGSLEPEIRNPS